MRRGAWLLLLASLILAANINYANVNHELDPASQNTPSCKSQRHLRPPPPRIPPQYDIFLGISAYRDGERCGFTLFTAFSRATHPSRVQVGVVDQVLKTDPSCLAEYCKLAVDHWGECKFKDQIQIDSRDALKSQGPTMARHAQQLMIGDQEFCLQLDAHSQLLFHWDTTLVAEWGRTENEMAVLTTYPPRFDKIGPNLTYPHMHTTHLCDHTKRRDAGGMPFCIGYWYLHKSELPQLSAFWGGGLSFSKCHAERRVPVDNQTKWLFFGEESLRSYALWSNGYDFYSPSRHGTVVFHNWTIDPNRTKDVEVAWQTTGQDAAVFLSDMDKGAVARRAHEKEKSRNRVRAVLKLPFDGPVDTTNLHVFYNGSVRTVDAFLDFHGVSNVDVALDEERCHQLHWVPYTRPEIVEELLPGWHMHQPPPLIHQEDVSNTAMAALGELKVAGHDTHQDIQHLKAQLEQSLDQYEALQGQLDAMIEAITRDQQLHHNDSDRMNVLANAFKDENAAQTQRWLDLQRDKDHRLRALELQLKHLDDRTTLAPYFLVMPALAISAALALVALATRWRGRSAPTKLSHHV